MFSGPTNKSTRICLNIFGDSVIQSLKNVKIRKSGLVPMLRQEKLADLFLVFPAILETWQKVFHLYSFIKHSRNESPLGTFWSIVSNGYYGNNDRYKNFHFSFGYVFICKFYKYTKFHNHQVTGEKVTNDQNFKFFVSGHLNSNWTGLF